ncbi:ADA1A protein, partial [Crypturellus soui]|nr:ADA1A protein [Crypturellus soui]
MVLLAGNASDCSNCTHSAEPLSVSRAVLLGLILGGLIIFGVLGNIVVILSVACHRHLQSVTHYYIINLAVADLLLTSSVLPFSATMEILGYWAFGRIFCNIWAAVDVLCCTASIMGLCIISIDRYIGVSYPLRYPSIVTKKRALWALLCVWVLSLVISIGPLFGWKEPAPEDETVCLITEEPGYVLFSALGSFYLPLAIILVMYCRVYVVARRESKGLTCGLKTEKSRSEEVTLRIHRKNAPGASGSTSNSKSKHHFSVRLLKFSREKKAAKTLGIVVGCFVLCWLPFFVVMPLGSFFPAMKAPDTLFKITFWLGYLNSCINPIIYPCSSQEFKKAFQNVLRAPCLPRKPKTKQQAPNFNLNHPASKSRENPKGVVRIPVGSGETFYRISKSDGVCEWKLFSPGQNTPAKRAAKGKRKGFLRECCCAGASGKVLRENRETPTVKIRAMSLGGDGEDV